MKILITLFFAAAVVAAFLSHTAVISTTSMVAPLLFAVGLILVLLRLMNEGDQRY